MERAARRRRRSRAATGGRGNLFDLQPPAFLALSDDLPSLDSDWGFLEVIMLTYFLFCPHYCLDFDHLPFTWKTKRSISDFYKFFDTMSVFEAKFKSKLPLVDSAAN
jgi:hypothetical protein